jgi:glucose-1-phosphate adenylyltransferase
MLQPTLMEDAQIRGSLIADGCRIGKGAVIENSMIGIRCIIGEGVTLRNTVVFGADYYENDRQQAQDRDTGVPPVGIGSGSIIEGAIIDKNCHIGRNVRLVNKLDREDTDQYDPCLIRDGVAVVVKDSVLPDGWKL